MDNSIVKLAFKIHESTKHGLMRVKKTPFRKRLRRYEAREVGF